MTPEDHGQATGVLALLEDRATEVDLDYGIAISPFWDPPHYPPGARPGGQEPPEPVKRWRVRLPNWFPKGSWLDSQHAYPSLTQALVALDEAGALDALKDFRASQSATSAARQKAFSKLMSAHVRRDQSYDELLRARHDAARKREEAGR